MSLHVDEHELPQTSGKVEILPFLEEGNFEQVFFCKLQEGRDCGVWIATLVEGDFCLRLLKALL